VQYSKIGIIANNRWEWAAVASAAYSLNATIVPMYEAQLPDDWTYIINDSGCSTLFCATESIFDTFQKEVLPSTPFVQAALCFDGPAGDAHSFQTALDKVGATEAAVIEPTVEDLADLIYTSGTTGKPKGVELTHNNIVSNVKAGVRTMVENPHNFIHESDRTLAFLPWAHSYGQTCELWGCMSQGASIGIGRGVPLILEDLQHVKPTILFSVPTLYKRIYDGVHNMMESSSPLRKGLMKRALDMGRRKADAVAGLRSPLGPLETLQHKILDKVILDKIRARFGGNLKHAFVAGAACPAEVLDFMDDLGIAVCEGYGLTETSPIIAINTPENRRNGFVGRPIGGVEVLIMNDGKQVADGEEGEICCVGPNVMRSYHKNPEATAEVISTAPDGVSRMYVDHFEINILSFISTTMSHYLLQVSYR
jgi:long-chain acyl-CoA synthetase